MVSLWGTLWVLAQTPPPDGYPTGSLLGKNVASLFGLPYGVSDWELRILHHGFAQRAWDLLCFSLWVMFRVLCCMDC